MGSRERREEPEKLQRCFSRLAATAATTALVGMASRSSSRLQSTAEHRWEENGKGILATTSMPLGRDGVDEVTIYRGGGGDIDRPTGAQREPAAKKGHSRGSSPDGVTALRQFAEQARCEVSPMQRDGQVSDRQWRCPGVSWRGWPRLTNG